MAYSSGYTGDATGGIGQGLAFVLPEGNAAKYAMQLAQTHASQLQDLAKQKFLMQQKSQAQYEKDFKDQVLPKAFAPFDKELNDRHNKWLQDASKSYATTGKNPFNDPNFVARYNTDVITPASKSLELGQNYTKLRAIAETDPTNKYTKASKQAVIDYQSQIEKDPMSALDKPLPRLEETPLSADDLVKTLKTTSVKSDDGTWETKGPDSSNHKAQAFAALLGDNKWHPLLKQYGYNPDLPDFGVYTDPKHPTGKRVWYTNDTFTSHQADEILGSPEDPRNAKILQTLGIDPKVDTYAKEKLQHAIADQNDAMGRAVTDISTRKDAEVPVEKVRKFGAENLSLAEQRLGIAEERLNLAKDKAVQNSDQIIEDMRNHIPGSGEIIKAHFKTNPAYLAEPDIWQDPKDPDKMTIVIPRKVRPNPNYNPSLPESKINTPTIEVHKKYPINLDARNEADFHAKMAYVIKESGGEKKLNKEASYLHGTKTPEKAIPSQTIKSLVGRKGYEGYTEQELIDYYKKQGYTIK